MDLLLTAGLPWPTILYTLLIDEIMIITGLIGALVYSSYKVSRRILIRKSFTDEPCSGDTSYSGALPSSGLPGLWFSLRETMPEHLAKTC